ncbi:gas vesicle protein [Streptomyces lydicus]|uniref:gas vesicle protein n=1 Tax=Streptomyces lydicus TaxID=47763 RepID=UPI003713A088
MTEPAPRRTGDYPSRAAPYGQGSSANLADILERVLDKGIVIAGDIQINLLDIELLTIKLRLLVASVDKAKEMGIDWWEHDPALSSRAADGNRSLAEENQRLRAEIEQLRASGTELPAAEESPRKPAEKKPRKSAEESPPESAEESPRAARTSNPSRTTRGKKAEARPRKKRDSP